MFSNNSYWHFQQVTEWFGELIDTGNTTIRGLAKRFGLPLDNLLRAQPKRSDDVYHFFGAYYPKRRADQDFLEVSTSLPETPTLPEAIEASDRQRLTSHLPHEVRY